MTSLKAMIGQALGPRLFRSCKVLAAKTLSRHFRRLDVGSEVLRNLDVRPGDKVQFLLGDGFRTYTPFAYDAAEGRFSTLVYLHGTGPGADFGRGARADDGVLVFGPRRSLAIDPGARPTLVVGDETCLALARAVRDTRSSDRDFHLIVESSDPDTRAVASTLGLQADVIAREPGDAHLDGLAALARSMISELPGAQLVLAGKATTVRHVRNALKDAVAKHTVVTRAYWAPGKRGLD